MPFRMKRADRASRRICEYHMIYTDERHPSLLHLTLMKFSRFLFCQMSVDKRFLICNSQIFIDSANLVNILCLSKCSVWNKME